MQTYYGTCSLCCSIPVDPLTVDPRTKESRSCKEQASREKPFFNCFVSALFLGILGEPGIRSVISSTPYQIL